MPTEPSHTITVTVAAHLDDNPGRSVERTALVPPDYGAIDLVQFYGVIVEDAAGELLRESGWNQPVRRALFVNDAKLTHIESLLGDGDLSDAIRAVIMTSDEDALAQWGGGEAD